jgi:hypothetical protein
MIFNKIQLLRNKPIQIERDEVGTFIRVQPPTISNLYDDSLFFFTIQLVTMELEELKDFLKVQNKKFNRINIINTVLEEAKESHEILSHLQKIIFDLSFEEGFLCVDRIEITNKEIEKISKLLRIAIGEERYEEYSEEPKELTDQEKRLLELEEKIKKKKETQKETDKTVESKSVLEDIIISVTYEFGFTMEHIMNMNYFTLLWYYSYTGRIHVYRINQFAIGSGMVKKINTDYFTSLK